MTREYCPRSINVLPKGAVFCFGSNGGGFHGAGAAGVAMRGTSRNSWRQDKPFLRALKTPLGSPERIGRWAVLGVGRGFQEGHYGLSYAIETVTHPGRRKSVPLSRILKQLKELGQFAREHEELKFLVVISGGGYNGWTIEEMKTVYRKWCKEDPPPDNVLLKREYEFRDES
jgi:hypothetical protein